MRARLLPVLLLALALLGLVVGVALRSANARPPQQWPMRSSEIVALEGLRDRLSRLDSEIARITSGQPDLARSIVAIALEVRHVDAAERSLVDEAKAWTHAGPDVALIQSGSFWEAQVK